jgi:uncharacterized protein (TIGR03083 family)
MPELTPLKPIFVTGQLESVEELLLDLLRGLEPADWDRATIVPGWTVKHIAAHLLDTHLRKLSIVRDNYPVQIPGASPEADLAAFVNRLNRDGVDLYSRLSPAVLISLIESAARQSIEFHRSLDPFAKAVFAVSWVGETESQNWLDTARELTERWHHQQQIRMAVDKPGIMTPELYFPVLDTFMRALPFHYRNVDAGDGTLIEFTVSGECGSSWYLYRDNPGWKLIAEAVGDPAAETVIPEEIAWRIFTKGIDRNDAARQVTVKGEKALGYHIVEMVSIVG